MLAYDYQLDENYQRNRVPYLLKPAFRLRRWDESNKSGKLMEPLYSEVPLSDEDSIEDRHSTLRYDSLR